MQLFIQIIVNYFLLLLVSLSFKLLYITKKYIVVTLAFFLTIPGYLIFLLFKQNNVGLGFSIIVSIVVTLLMSIIIDFLFLRYFERKKLSSFLMFILSLALYVILQNIISIIWGDDTQSLRSNDVKVGHLLFSSYITNIQIIIIFCGLILFSLVLFILKFSSIGLSIRTISENENLLNIVGTNSKIIKFVASLLGFLIGAITGVLISFYWDITPNMGFSILLYGIIIVIISGLNNLYSILIGTLILVVSQSLTAYFIGGKWIDVISFTILLLVLIYKPMGLSNSFNKKINL